MPDVVGVDGLRRGRGDHEARHQRRPAWASSCAASSRRARRSVLGHRAHAEGREGRLPRAPGADPDRPDRDARATTRRREAPRRRTKRGEATRRRCRASCSARSCTSTSCASSWAARSTSPARCAASARSGPMPKLKPFRVAGHFYTRHVRVRFQAGLRRRCADAQKFLGMAGEVTGIEIRTTTPEARDRRRRRDRRAAWARATRSARGRS